MNSSFLEGLSTSSQFTEPNILKVIKRIKKISNTEIPQADFVKYLGIHLDKRLF